MLNELNDYLRNQAESNKALININEKPRILPIRKKSEPPSQIKSYIDRPFRISVLVNAYKLGKLFQVRLKPGTTQTDQG